MKEQVRLKSFPNGIKIVIEENAAPESFLKEVAEKFKDSEKFFGKAKLAVSFEGKKLSQEEEDAVLDTIKEVSSVNVVCVVSRESDDVYERAVGTLYQMLESDTAQFYRGNLTGKEIFESEQSVIILGDVPKGSCIVSKKNIIILGTLSGSAYAGADGKSRFVAALSMNPESVRIGEYKGKYKAKGLLGRKKAVCPQVAYIKENEIVFDDLLFTEELLQNLD